MKKNNSQMAACHFVSRLDIKHDESKISTSYIHATVIQDTTVDYDYIIQGPLVFA